jgi:hypothetical protein
LIKRERRVHKGEKEKVFYKQKWTQGNTELGKDRQREKERDITKTE